MVNAELYCGDMLDIIRNTPPPDLVYMDPPYNTGKSWGDFSDSWGGSENYLSEMEVRLKAIHDHMKSSGTLYLHVDQNESHYLKCTLDSIFGRSNFMNDIVWSYNSGGGTKKRFGRKHDNILVYAKEYESHTFNVQREPYPNEYGGGPGFHKDGRMMGDVWDIKRLSNTAKERTGYATQKPERLLERIIASSSNVGDVVLDPCCGSGTTLVAAKNLGRTPVGIDINPSAIEMAKGRLSNN